MLALLVGSVWGCCLLLFRLPVCVCVFSPEVVDGGVVVCGNFCSMCFFWEEKMTQEMTLMGRK